jgi:hypothetical protein
MIPPEILSARGNALADECDEAKNPPFRAVKTTEPSLLEGCERMEISLVSIVAGEKRGIASAGSLTPMRQISSFTLRFDVK